MKKWLIVLSMICGLSAVTAATFGGYAVLNAKEMVYEDSQAQDLNIQDMQNVYIKSSIPVEIFSTTGQPRAEFIQKSTNFIKNFPTYDLNITAKEGNVYINLEQKERTLWLKNGKDDAYLTIYLPETTIEHLTVESKSPNQTNRMHNVDLKNININDLNMELYQNVMINLEGDYKRISLNTNNAYDDRQKTLNVKSNTPATLRMSGNVLTYLEGQFEKVNIDYCNNDITIRSQLPCQVAITNSDDSEVDLRGQYNSILIDGYRQKVNLDSDIECKLNITGGNNILYAKGPFRMINLDGYDSKLEVQTTIVPRDIQMGEKMNSQVKLILPSNIPGFTINGTLPCDIEEEQDIESIEVVVPYETTRPHITELLNKAIESDFETTTQINKNQYRINYGNNTTKININTTMNEDFQLEIIDGGYSVTV